MPGFNLHFYATPAPIMPDYRRALCPVRRGVITGIRPYARYQGSIFCDSMECIFDFSIEDFRNPSTVESGRTAIGWQRGLPGFGRKERVAECTNVGPGAITGTT